MDADAAVEGLTIAQSENWDSFTPMELVAAFEDAFQIELSADEITRMTSFALIAEVLRHKGAIEE